MWKYVIAWIPMVAIAIANGVIRGLWYEKPLGELRAHQVSSVTGILLFSIYIGILVRIWPPESAKQAVAIGLIWLALTVAFEFLFGHYVARHSWRRLLYDYNIFAGRLWILVLIWVTIAPYVFYRL